MQESQTPPAASTTSSVIYDLDLANSRLDWSDELITVFGYSREEPASSLEWWANHVHPEDAMLLNQIMDKLYVPTIIEWTVEYRFRKADNSYVRVRDHAVVLRRDNGEAVRLSGTLTPLD